MLPLILLLAAAAVLTGWLWGRRAAQHAAQLAALQRQLDEALARAYVDPLTGAHTRGYLEFRLAQAQAQALRSAEPLALLLFDIDNFKAVNDQTQSHQVGDQVLRALCDFLHARMRKGDVLARYGGDEFAVIAPQTDLPGALLLAQRMQQGIEGELVVDTAAGPQRIRCSFGVAGLGQPPQEPAELLAQADKAMYAAKKSPSRIVAA